MKNIETEIRSFISEAQYDSLQKFFHQNAEFLREDNQETFYFDGPLDLRIQRNDFFSKVWMKKGQIHDDSREEVEIKFDKEDFEKLEKLFLSLGYNAEIKWFRKRLEFSWNDIGVCLDYTKGYGYIIELEKMTSAENKEKEYERLKQKMKELNIDITSKDEFDQKFKYYKENWRTLIN